MERALEVRDVISTQFGEASLRESVQPGNDSGAAKVHPAIPARLIIIALDILRMCRPPIVEHFFGVSDDRSDRASHTLRIPTLTGNTFVRLRRKEHRQSLRPLRGHSGTLAQASIVSAGRARTKADGSTTAALILSVDRI